jgi:hypothetical protein
MTAQRRYSLRLALTAGLTTLIVLAGAGVSYALWTTSAQVSSTATAATVGVSQTVPTPIGLNLTYSSGSRKAASPVTVTNTSTHSGTVTLSVGVISATDVNFPGAVAVEMAVVTSANNCASNSNLSGATTGVLSTSTSVSVSVALAASASAIICVQTSITSQNLNAFSGKSLTGRLASTVAVGTWTSSTAVQQFTQSASAAVVYPALACTNASNFEARFAWSPTPMAPTTYKLYVNGTLVPNQADGYNSYVLVNSTNVPFASFPQGTATVLVTKVLTGGGEEVIGDGSVTLGSSTNRTYQCGSGGSTGTATPTPPPIGSLTCGGGNGSNYIMYSFPANTGFEGSTVYKIYVNGIFVYDYTNGYYTVVQMYNNTAPQVTSAVYGSGVKTVEVQQSVGGGAYVTAYTGLINIGNGNDKLTCG